MSREQRLGPSPFKVEVKPMMEGANPYQESKFKGNTRELNPRAVLEETVYLYEGTVENRKLGRTSGAQVKGFMEIRSHFFPDRERVYHPFFYWGLKDGETNKSYEGYGDSSTYVDPTHAFRAVKILDALPTFSESKDQAVRDYVDAMMGTEQGEFEDFGFWYGKDEAAFFSARKRISSLIGQDRLDEILELVPPNLQAMIQIMRKKQIGIDTRTLKREIDLGRILPSELYRETIEDHDREIQGIAKGLEATGGRW